MGEPKAFLPWKDGQTLLSYQIFQWRQAGFQPWVVLGSQHLAAAQPHLAGAEVLVNPAPELGKTHSIRVGVEGIPADFQVLAISAVDQPRPAWIYHSLLEYHLRHRAWVTVPVHRGRRGAPYPDRQALAGKAVGSPRRNPGPAPVVAGSGQAGTGGGALHS